MNGWIKLHRKILDNPIVTKDADYLAVWVYLLLSATHEEYSALFMGSKITLKPGQLITGRKSIAEHLSINESKVKRILIDFENYQQIGRQRSNKNSLISILNWEKYQFVDQQNDHRMTNERPADDQQMTSERPASDHKQEYKNDENEENNKRGKAETMEQIFERLLPDYSISEVLADKLREWIKYKREKKDGYKEQGMKSLLSQVSKHNTTHGDIAICNLIDLCMSNGWKGIIWDKLSSPNHSGGIGNRVSEVDNW